MATQTDQPRRAAPVPGRGVPKSVRRFMDTEASGGILLLAAAVVALIWANSPWSASYQSLFHTDITMNFGRYVLTGDLHHWVNDALMVVFFFVVGLEIKGELVHGKLRDPRTAAMPAVAALGGMVVPALLYLLVNAGGDGARGWGIPMATDIAFAVGVVDPARSPGALVAQVVPVDAGHRRRHRGHHRHRHLLLDGAATAVPRHGRGDHRRHRHPEPGGRGLAGPVPGARCGAVAGDVRVGSPRHDRRRRAGPSHAGTEARPCQRRPGLGQRPAGRAVSGRAPGYDEAGPPLGVPRRAHRSRPPPLVELPDRADLRPGQRGRGHQGRRLRRPRAPLP